MNWQPVRRSEPGILDTNVIAIYIRRLHNHEERTMAPSPNTAKTQTLNPPKWFDGVDHVGWTEPPRFFRRQF
jgi:hypothetical protein